MTWTLTPLAADPAPQLEIWRQLVATAAIRHPLLDVDYLELAVRHLGPGENLHWLQYTAAGRIEVAGIVEPRGRGRWASWFSPQLPVTPLLSPAPAVLAAATAGGGGLFAALGPTSWRLKLFDVDPAYITAPARLGALPQVQLPTHQTVAIEFPADGGGYWDSRPRDLQRNVARSMRKLEAQGGTPQLRVLVEREAMAAAVSGHATLEQSGWKGAQGTAMRADDTLGVFYRAVLERYAARGAARVFQLYAGEQLIASQLCIETAAVLATMKTTYHGSYVNCSPGRILDHLMLQQLQAEGAVRRCEFCMHAGKSDLLWATEVRTLQQVEIYRSALLREVMMQGRSLRRRFRRSQSATTAVA